MSLPTNSSYPSPLGPYANQESLPDDQFNEDGVTLVNPPSSGPKSVHYDQFPSPLGHGGMAPFDFHVFFMQHTPSDAQYAKELHQRIRREFPEMKIRKIWNFPIGPFPVGQFEVNPSTPHEMGALYSFMVLNRGPCSVLIHPNTGVPKKDHTELGTWMGRPWPLNVDILTGRPPGV